MDLFIKTTLISKYTWKGNYIRHQLLEKLLRFSHFIKASKHDQNLHDYIPLGDLGFMTNRIDYKCVNWFTLARKVLYSFLLYVVVY